MSRGGAGLYAIPALPALVEGSVSHQRLTPFRRAFRHRVYQWLVDLDDLPRLRSWLRPLASFSAADHLGDPDLSIRENVTRFVAGHGYDVREGRVLMLANARVLGRVFDPLTVFWCLAPDGSVTCVVAEVRNTYGERHAYVLEPDTEGRAETEKRLYVSPFFDVTGCYQLRFRLDRDFVTTTVILRRSGESCFAASFQGTPRAATTRALLAISLRKPLMPLRVSALIRLHGLVLWARRLPIVPRPRHENQEGMQ